MSTRAIEAETQEIGRELFARLERRSPSIFERRWWDDRILSWAMADESVKVQMFRFIDVLPMLHSSEAVTRHLQEYFDDVRTPALGRPPGHGRSHAATAGRQGSGPHRSVERRSRTPQRFIAGANVDEVLAAVMQAVQAGVCLHARPPGRSRDQRASTPTRICRAIST